MNDIEYDYRNKQIFFEKLLQKKMIDAINNSPMQKNYIAKSISKTPNALYKYASGINIPNFIVIAHLTELLKISPLYWFDENMSFEEALKNPKKEKTYTFLDERLKRIEEKIDNSAISVLGDEQMVKLIAKLNSMDKEKKDKAEKFFDLL